MAKKQKLVERAWAIRIGNFRNGKPEYLQVYGVADLFETRKEAMVRIQASIAFRGKAATRSWVIVRVDVTER